MKVADICDCSFCRDWWATPWSGGCRTFKILEDYCARDGERLTEEECEVIEAAKEWSVDHRVVLRTDTEVRLVRAADALAELAPSLTTQLRTAAETLTGNYSYANAQGMAELMKRAAAELEKK